MEFRDGGRRAEHHPTARVMVVSIIEGAVQRMLPRLTPVNRPFWTGGGAGELLIQRCASCQCWIHPPTERCPACGGEVRPEPVSGRGTIFTFTINAHQFHPSVLPPNLIAIVELAEQSDLRIPTNIVNCDPADAQCGLPVQVLFEHHGEVYYPVFGPLPSAS